MLNEKIKYPLYLQLIHALLCIIWNLAGLGLISAGLAPLGPVASWAVVVACAIMGGLLWWGARSLLWLYVLVTILQLLLSMNAVISPFIKDPALWVYASGRFAGLAINLVGVVATLWGLGLCVKFKGTLAKNS